MPSGVLAKTEEHWDLDGPMPLPKGDWLRCPVCRGEEVIPKRLNYHTRPEWATVPRRCDVVFKCCDCAMVWQHGIALSEEHFRRWVPAPLEGAAIEHPEVKLMLKEVACAVAA